MTEFTSGEWVADDLTETVNTVSDDARTICIITTNDAEDFSNEDRANARLIAAAPEMYRLLKSVANYKPDFVWDVVFHAQELLARIDGEEAEE